jgi:hypothetical protein
MRKPDNNLQDQGLLERIIMLIVIEYRSDAVLRCFATCHSNLQGRKT